MSTDLAVIEAALKAATPGPWETWPHAHIEDGCRCLSCQFVTVWQTRNSLDCEDVPRKPGESERCEASGYSWEDANLIANAPTWLAELVERVKVAEAEAATLREREITGETAGEAMVGAELKRQATRRAAAEAAIGRVRALHREHDHTRMGHCVGDPCVQAGRCDGCRGFTPHPECPTLRALGVTS